MSNEDRIGKRHSRKERTYISLAISSISFSSKELDNPVKHMSGMIKNVRSWLLSKQ